MVASLSVVNLPWVVYSVFVDKNGAIEAEMMRSSSLTIVWTINVNYPNPRSPEWLFLWTWHNCLRRVDLQRSFQTFSCIVHSFVSRHRWCHIHRRDLRSLFNKFYLKIIKICVDNIATNKKISSHFENIKNSTDSQTFFENFSRQKLSSIKIT